MWSRTNFFKLTIFICAWSLLVILTLRLLIGKGGNRYGSLSNEDANKFLYLANMWHGRALNVDNEGVAAASMHNKELTTEQLVAALQQELPNVPFEFWYRAEQQHPMQKNDTCAKSPDVMKLEFHNNYWQIYHSANVSFHLYGAYYDNRSSVESGPVLRLLGLANTTSQSFPPSYCQVWYEQQSAPEIVRVSMYSFIWQRHWDIVQNQSYPYLLTCVLPESLGSLVPQAVSLVAEECATATNSLKVHFDHLKWHEKKQRFAICVKGLDFPYGDVSARLVEWLELMQLLGVQKIFAYDLAVHANVAKVLRYYQQQGFLEVHPISLATGGPRLPHFQHFALKMDPLNGYLNELIPYNDCFYRNMYKYEYLALLDIDEVIMPLGKLTKWSELLEIVQQLQQSISDKCQHGFSSICFRHVLYPNSAAVVRNVPNYMHMLQHTLRMRNHSEPFMSTKCFHNTTAILTVHNHIVIDELKSCGVLSIETHQAQLQHYRNWFEPEQAVQAEKSLIEDRSIWRYKEELAYSTRKVLKELDLLC